MTANDWTLPTAEDLEKPFERRDAIDKALAQRLDGGCVCDDPTCPDSIWTGQMARAMGSLVEAVIALGRVATATRTMWRPHGEPGGCEDPTCTYEVDLRRTLLGTIGAQATALEAMMVFVSNRLTGRDPSPDNRPYHLAFYGREALAMVQESIKAMKETGIPSDSYRDLISTLTPYLSDAAIVQQKEVDRGAEA